MEAKGSHTENRKYNKYGMRSKTGKYLVKCPFCENSYTVAVEMGRAFVCTNCNGIAGLEHVVREITAQSQLHEMHDVLIDNHNLDEIDDVRDAGNNSEAADEIRDIMERFIFAVSTKDKEYILSKLHRSGLSSSMTDEQRFQKFKRTSIGKYLGNENIGLKDATYLSGYPWPEGYSMLQSIVDGDVDFDGDGIPDNTLRGYQHFEVTLNDGEVFDVYFFEGEDKNWTLRIL